MASVVIVVKCSDQSELRGTDSGHQTLQAIANRMQAMASGNAKGTVRVHSGTADPVAASGTITLATVAADDTVVIGGVTFTAKASPSGESQFSQAGSDTADAASLAAKINAHSTLSQVVSATSANAVVTVTALQRGVIGNFITMSQTGGTMTLSGSALAGGTGGATNAAQTYSFE